VDLESTLDELYALRPHEFTAVRNQRAAEARRAGDRELAERIRALRRPTVSAWAGNMLVRREPDKVRPLISLGEGLREAHRNLDGEQLRELGRQQHLLVGALAREARRLAAEEGQSVGEAAFHEIEATLHAVLADPKAAQQWAAGHLDRPLNAPVGFTGLEASAGATVRPARPARREPEPPPESPPEPSPEPAEDAGARRREKLDRARQDAEEAERQARERERAHEEASAALERSQAALDEISERVAALAQELEEARERQRQTERELRDARDEAARTSRAARDARRRADKAATVAERLGAGA
jgi:DNA repair exonuclease SbcCD ATPase subunit